MGFTKISLAFYDQPELIHRINQDLTDFNLRILGADCEGLHAHVCHDRRGHVVQSWADDFRTAFEEFIAPYYRKIVPRLQETISFRSSTLTAM